MPRFADFFGKKGLQTLLDNIEIRGIEFKEKGKSMRKKKPKQQQQQQVQQMQLQMQMKKNANGACRRQKQLQSPSDGQFSYAIQESHKMMQRTMPLKSATPD